MLAPLHSLEICCPALDLTDFIRYNLPLLLIQ
jgi:hypothetical protein